MKSQRQDLLVTLSETFNRILTAENSTANLNGNAWNSLVKVSLTSQKKLAYELRNRPRGLMRAVGSVFDPVSASPMPSSDFLVGKNTVMKAKHSFKEKEIYDLLDDKGKQAFAAGDLTATKIMYDKSYAQLVQDLVSLASNSLVSVFYNQIAAICCDALNGQVTLDVETGDPYSFSTDVIDVGTASPLWSDATNATPYDDFVNPSTGVNAALQTDPKNDGNRLTFGSTVMSDYIFSQMIQTTDMRDRLTATVGGGGQIGYVNPSYEEFNRIFYRGGAITPSFGKVVVDPRSSYLNAAGLDTAFLNQNAVFSASGTEREVVGGLPPQPYQIYLSPIKKPSRSDNTSVSDQRGATLEIYDIDTRKVYGDSGHRGWELVLSADLTFVQFKPSSKLTVV